MIKAKGIAAQTVKAPLAAWSFERRDPGPHDVVMDVKYCGICHSDIHQARDEWGGAIFPMVPGHEIAGVVRVVGSSVTKFKVGDQIGVGCMVNACRECDNCKAGLENYCLKGANFTYNSRDKDGSPTYGGYSDVLVVNEDFGIRIPNSLTLDVAAPLLCAGITLYSPLRHWKAGPGKKVGIVGLGGLGHMGVKYAAAMGAEVTVLSTSDNKREDALRMGAKHFVVTKDKAAMDKIARSFDLIINTVSADIDMEAYFKLLETDGALVAVGMPEKKLTFHPGPLVSMRRTFAGSMIGGIKETQEMMDYSAEKNIVPDIETIKAEQINAAFERILKSEVRYRFVIDIATL